MAKALPPFLQVVKETLPAVGQLGTKFTKTFYGNMFKAHPELLNVFNKTNQAKGTQPAALFSMVATSAMDVLETGSLNQRVLDLVGQRHCALNVLPEQYDVVGTHILQTIEELLNPGETVLKSWGELYGILAAEMIKTEERIYSEAEKKIGGWRGLRDFSLLDKSKQSDDVTYFTFKPVDGKPVSSPVPGQFITVWPHPPSWEHTQPRHYTLTLPSRMHYSIAVKKQGLVSSFLHDDLKIGDTLPLSPPFGLFTCEGADKLWQQDEYIPAVFLSAGIGITPAISMLDSIAGTKRPIYWFHASGDGSHHPFRDYLVQMATHRPNFTRRVWYENPQNDPVPDSESNISPYHYKGRMNLHEVDSDMVTPHPKTNYFMCGPPAWMTFIQNSLINEFGVDKHRIHRESFESEMTPDNLE
eukprot:CAMPEP_0174260766 /NCGR_PEP_ID=MMETSP0439-20130205/10467_1 /TAXON_ID=0 /ORGANISM="Stereomyxa ramosa, Strain Chinc5" /LENGTH=413 /DNA_ID=CAMNT_0015345087 /DNA_START=13 /DNA_END=1251 /DNA_ORIENTATION=-